jgi:4-hydroxybenzoate polyprenyltransferase
MAVLRRLFEWIFYGHLWIALGAASLGWVSQFAAPHSSFPEWLIPLFLFLATLGVYTLHRSLSYQRAKNAQRFKRYGIVHRHPRLSLFIGWASLLGAVGCCLWFPISSWLILFLALPFTFFYLIPIWPGGKRLRDYSFFKVFWVALSWTLMTAIFPMVTHGLAQLSIVEYWRTMTGHPATAMANWPGTSFLYPEVVVRFLFTLSVAILFDFRDVALDASQSVYTLANRHPKLAKTLVYLFMGVCIFWQLPYLGAPKIGLLLFLIFSGPYSCTILVAFKTHDRRQEDWFAVAVNGVLILPGLMAALGIWLN